MEAVHGKNPVRYLMSGSDTQIPMWVRFRKRIQCVARQLASHYLFDILPSELATQYSGGKAALVAIRNKSYAVRGVLCKLSDSYWGLYVDVNEPMVYMSPAAKRQASVAYSQVKGFVWNSPTVFDSLQNIMTADKLSRPKRFSDLPVYTRSKVTAEHHTHLRPDEVLLAAKKLSSIRKYYVSCMVERMREAKITIEATAATLMTYALTADEIFVQLLIDSKAVWDNCKGETMLTKKLKQVSSQIKSINTSNYEPLTQFFELVVLVNRGVGEVDWRQERINRTDPNTANVDDAKVYTSCRKLFGRARKTYRYPEMSIDDYLDRRWEWVPGGSVHSQYEEDNDYIIPGMYTRNKFVTLNMMPKHVIRRFMAGKPEIRAWPSTKYEWGKQRAIYGTDLRSTVITNFAMFKCEDVLATQFPVGSEAEASKVHKRVGMMLDHADSFCFDYDDFNSQHSIKSMYAVLLAFRDEFANDMSGDQLIAMNWVCQSVREMWVLDRQHDDWYKLKGTLLSGWRLTTFINTVLNWVYMDIAGVFELDDVTDSVHNGDDVMIALTKPKTAINIMSCMSRINARAQVSKCNLFTVAEFLRVEHGAVGAEGLGAQYLARSCATLVHSRIESREPVSVSRLIEADNDRLKDLRARTSLPKSADVIEEQLELRTSKLFNVSTSDIKDVKRLHRVCGGVNNARWSDIDRLVVKEVGETQIPVEIDDPSSWPGVYDYSSRIEKMFGNSIPFGSILNAVVKGSRLTLAITRQESIKVVKNDNELKSDWERAMYGCYKGVSTSYYTAMSRFVAMPPVVNMEKGLARDYISTVKASVDQMRAMQILV